jgi:leader peptidase (prepilin peptidase) / N-methyltransferase
LVEVAIAFLFGLLLGSFANVCIYRLPRDLSVAGPRSECPFCEKTIAWYDNVPILSYFLLKGRCRNCKEPISWRYPIVELLVAAFCALAVYQYGFTLPALKQALLHFILVTLFFTDLETFILPDEFTLGGCLLGVALAWWYPSPWGLGNMIGFKDDAFRSLFNASASAGVFGAIFWAVSELYYRLRGMDGLGLGDVKMMMLLGAFLGLYHTTLVVFLASLSGALIGSALILAKKQSLRDTELPFGVYLASAGILISLFGKGLANYW